MIRDPIRTNRAALLAAIDGDAAELAALRQQVLDDADIVPQRQRQKRLDTTVGARCKIFVQACARIRRQDAVRAALLLGRVDAVAEALIKECFVDGDDVNLDELIIDIWGPWCQAHRVDAAKLAPELFAAVRDVVAKQSLAIAPAWAWACVRTRDEVVGLYRAELKKPGHTPEHRAALVQGLAEAEVAVAAAKQAAEQRRAASKPKTPQPTPPAPARPLTAAERRRRMIEAMTVPTSRSRR